MILEPRKNGGAISRMFNFFIVIVSNNFQGLTPINPITGHDINAACGQLRLQQESQEGIIVHAEIKK